MNVIILHYLFSFFPPLASEVEMSKLCSGNVKDVTLYYI